MTAPVEQIRLRLEALDVRIRVERGRLIVDGPAQALTPELLADLRERKAELVEALRAELSCSTGRRLYRSAAGVEVVRIDQLDPPACSPRFEKRFRREGSSVSLVGDVTTDPRVAAAWVRGLEASDRALGAAGAVPGDREIAQELSPPERV